MVQTGEIFVRKPYPEEPEELEAIYELRKRVLGEPIERSRYVEERFVNDAILDRVINAAAFDDNRNVVAAGRISEDRVGEWVLRYICVDEEFRGHGVGTEIVDYLTHAAYQRGAKRIEVKARLGDPDAPEDTDRHRGSVGFYTKLGFTATTPAYFRHGVQHLRMSKGLGSS